MYVLSIFKNIFQTMVFVFCAFCLSAFVFILPVYASDSVLDDSVDSSDASNSVLENYIESSDVSSDEDSSLEEDTSDFFSSGRENPESTSDDSEIFSDDSLKIEKSFEENKADENITDTENIPADSVFYDSSDSYSEQLELLANIDKSLEYILCFMLVVIIAGVCHYSYKLFRMFF